MRERFIIIKKNQDITKADVNGVTEEQLQQLAIDHQKEMSNTAIYFAGEHLFGEEEVVKFTDDIIQARHHIVYGDAVADINLIFINYPNMQKYSFQIEKIFTFGD